MNLFHKNQKYAAKKNELWIPIVYAMFYFPVFTWLNNNMLPRYYIRCWVDDLIPFCEWFVIPYVVWFLLIPGMLLLMHSLDRHEYHELCFMLFVGMTICLTIYFVLPNGLTLRRPLLLDNWAARLVAFIRHADEPVNVCPSIHVASSMAVFDVSRNSMALRRTYPHLRVFMLILCPLICISTLFLKQHSAIDVACGMFLTAFLRWLIQCNQARHRHEVSRDRAEV